MYYNKLKINLLHWGPLCEPQQTLIHQNSLNNMNHRSCLQTTRQKQYFTQTYSEGFHYNCMNHLNGLSHLDDITIISALSVCCLAMNTPNYSE